MPNINNHLNKIATATYGKDVRQAIVESIKLVNNGLDNIETTAYTTAEKEKLANIEAGANKTIVDSSLSTESENPVQNKAIKVELDKKADKEKVAEMLQGFTSPTFGGGFAGGYESTADEGGAIGLEARTVNGGAVGKGAFANGFRDDNGQLLSETGGAVGEYARAGRGFSGGFNALVAAQEGSDGTLCIDAIQLGTGINSEPRTAQIYDYQILDKNGKIPSDRLPNAKGGFNAGIYSSADFGAAVGSGAVTSKGFAGGFEAKTVDENGNGIDAVQIGTGTNITPNTVQFYDYQILDANGKIPSERLSEAILNVDSELSETSENPAQNKVIKAEIDGMKAKLLGSDEKLSADVIPDYVKTTSNTPSIKSYNADIEDFEEVDTPDPEDFIPTHNAVLKMATETCVGRITTGNKILISEASQLPTGMTVSEYADVAIESKISPQNQIMGNNINHCIIDTTPTEAHLYLLGDDVVTTELPVNGGSTLTIYFPDVNINPISKNFWMVCGMVIATTGKGVENDIEQYYEFADAPLFSGWDNPAIIEKGKSGNGYYAVIQIPENATYLYFHSKNKQGNYAYDCSDNYMAFYGTLSNIETNKYITKIGNWHIKDAEAHKEIEELKQLIQQLI